MRRLPPASVAGATALVALAVYGVASSPLFAVREVVVSGAGAATADWLRAQLSMTVGTNLLGIDASTLAAIAATEPRIAGIQLGRHLPSTLEVRVTPRDPVALVPVGDSAVEVDKHGLVLGAYRGDRSLPYVTGAVGPGDELEVLRTGPAPLARAAELTARLGDVVGDRLAEVHVESGGDDAWLFLQDGTTVRWGAIGTQSYRGLSPDDEQRLVVLDAVLRDMARRGPLRIDVRNPERVGVEPAARPQEDAPTTTMN